MRCTTVYLFKLFHMLMVRGWRISGKLVYLNSTIPRCSGRIVSVTVQVTDLDKNRRWEVGVGAVRGWKAVRWKRVVEMQRVKESGCHEWHLGKVCSIPRFVLPRYPSGPTLEVAVYVLGYLSVSRLSDTSCCGKLLQPVFQMKRSPKRHQKAREFHIRLSMFCCRVRSIVAQTCPSSTKYWSCRFQKCDPTKFE